LSARNRPGLNRLRDPRDLRFADPRAAAAMDFRSFAGFWQTKQPMDRYIDPRSLQIGLDGLTGTGWTWIPCGGGMYWLDPREKELVFDYCLGRCSPSQKAEAENLIDRNVAASRLRATIGGPVGPLSHAASEPCPDHLVDATIRRLCEQARREGRLQAAEPRVLPFDLSRRVRPAVAVAAVAACLVLAVGVLFTSLPSGPLQSPTPVSQQNAGDFLPRTAMDSPDDARFYVADGNQSPVPSERIPWPGEFNPYPPYPLFRQDVPMLPASLGSGSEFQSPGRFPAFGPAPTPNQPR